MSDLVERLLADMREVLGSARREPEDGFEGLTRKEWSKALGLGERAVMDRFRELWERGLLEVGQVRRPSMDGRSFLVPAYRPRLAETEERPSE